MRFTDHRIFFLTSGGLFDGSIGATGATGPAGTNGVTGATGPAGLNGTNGTNGTNGDTGATGPAGSSNWNTIVDPSGFTNISASPTLSIVNVGQTHCEISGRKFFYDPNKGFAYIGADNVGTGSVVANRGTNSVCLNTSTICRGTSSLATGSSQIHGGSFNLAGGNGSSFIGQVGSTTGDMNICYGDDCSVRNSASNNFVFGRASSVRSTGQYCVAMGNNCNSLFGSHNFLFGVSCGTTAFTNAFIYNANSGSQLNSTANNQILMNGYGGYRFYTDSTNTIGVSLAASANSWAIISDRRMKTDIVEANYDDVLDKVSRVPVYHYRFKSRECLKQAHEECGYEACCPVENSEGGCPYENTLEVNPLCFGSMSQEWNAIFSGNVQDPLSINTNEVMFSAIAAIKALKNKVDYLTDELNELKKFVGLNTV